MISLDIKSKSQSPTTLNLPTSDEEPKLSFSDLLKGVSVKKDEKIIETTSLVVDIKTDKSKKIDNIENVISKGFKQGSDETPNENLLKTPSTKENFIALLKNETVVSDEPKGFLESTIKQTTYLSTKGLKALVADAKEYLKSKIIQSDGFQKSEIKELPKTLKGLSTLAEKFDINVSKITLEDVKAVDKKSLSESLNSSVKSQTTQDAIKNLSIVGLKSREKIIVKDEKPQELKPLEQMLKLSKDKKIETAEIPKDIRADKKLETAEIPKDIRAEKKIETAEIPKDIKAEKKIETAEIPKDIRAEKKIETAEIPKDIRAEKKIETAEIPKEIRAEKKIETAEIPKEIRAEKKIETAEIPKEIRAEKKIETAEIPKEIRAEKKIETAEIPKDIRADKNIPPKIDTEISQIVKSQNRVENIIEQRVQTKQFKVEEKTQKSRATETLQSLLRGEKPSINPQIFTPTPSSPLSTATSETTKGLESLLHSEKSDNSTLSKLDGLSTNKVDSFEVKVNEAKQMIRYLSSDVKTAIEDYKSPFTRIKLQLNPQKLGDVEVTMVQRGSNLHVNISSNTAAINTLAMNMNELRVQLNNSGINNATINFNNTTQNSDTSSGQQQQNNQQEQQKARREYNYFDNREDTNEEILNSLEIVVPNYA